jgi:hypothetical protein
MFQLPDGGYVQQVSSTMGKWADGFAYGAAATVGANSTAAISANWNVAKSAGDATLKLNNGNLQINMGVAANAELLMVGNNTNTVPQNLIVSLMLSQRIAGNEVRIGYVQVDPSTGLPVPNANLANFYQNMASIMFNGATSTTAVAESMEGAQAALKSVAMTGLTTTTTLQDYSIECRPEDVTYSSQVADSSALRLSTAPRISSVVPNPNYVYRPFIWVRNTAVPASNTVVTVQRVISMDIQELQVEVGGGRGNAVASQAIPVYQVGSSTVPASITGANVTSGSNGNVLHKLTSAATGNATLVKATAGRIYGGSITNTGATPRFLKLFNTTTAPVLGTSVPVLTIPLLPGQTHSLLSSVVSSVYGLYFSNGIAYALTANDGDLDATAIVASEVYVNLVYA